jgi:hypothetical protein
MRQGGNPFWARRDVLDRAAEDRYLLRVRAVTRSQNCDVLLLRLRQARSLRLALGPQALNLVALRAQLRSAPRCAAACVADAA